MLERTIFTNMFSLLYNTPYTADWPVSLTLPRIDFSVLELDDFPPPPDKKSNEFSRGLQTDNEVFSLTSDLTSVDHDVPEPYDGEFPMVKKPYKAPRPRRRRKAWKCKHVGRQHYAKGICQFCYLKEYHADRKERLKNTNVLDLVNTP